MRSLTILITASLVLTACDPREVMPVRQFYAASTSMEPTLPAGEEFTAWRVSLDELKRGDILIVKHHTEDWIFRLAGLPGDTVAMEGGTFILNGRRIEQRKVGTKRVDVEFESHEATVLRERFPGEKRWHRVLDTGESFYDDYPERKLGPDEYFLLGDNRDNAADSRVDGQSIGMGIVKGEQIKRRVEVD